MANKYVVTEFNVGATGGFYFSTNDADGTAQTGFYMNAAPTNGTFYKMILPNARPTGLGQSLKITNISGGTVTLGWS